MNTPLSIKQLGLLIIHQIKIHYLTINSIYVYDLVKFVNIVHLFGNQLLNYPKLSGKRGQSPETYLHSI